jgi:hypothetical protein
MNNTTGEPKSNGHGQPDTPVQPWTDEEWATRGADDETLDGPDADALLRLAKLKTKHRSASERAQGYARGIAHIEREWAITPDPEFDPDATVAERYGVVSIADLDVQPPEPLLSGRIASRGSTILFGPGGSRKGTLACLWLIDYCRAHPGETVLLLDYEDHPEEWKPRIISLGGGDVAGQIVYVPVGDPDVWHGAPAPIWDQIDDLERIAGECKPSLIVVDSIQEACAADVSGGDTSLPGQYNAALRTLAERWLSIAHTPKGEREPLYPFGSQRWHTSARATWLLVEHGETTSMLLNRKNSNGRKLGKRLVEFHYASGDAGLPLQIEENSYTESVADLIETFLADAGESTQKQIVQALNDHDGDDATDDEPKVQPEAVRQALSRGSRGSTRRPPRFRKLPNDRWALPDAGEAAA